MTIRDLVTEILLILGVIGQGETPDGPTAAGVLRVLNSMIDGWATEHLLVYVIDRQEFAIASNTQTYTLGPGGTWNTTPLYGAGAPRPLKIEYAAWLQTSPQLVELPIGESMTEQEYRHLLVRDVPGSMPLRFYYEPQFPLGKVFVWPKPLYVGTMVLYLWHPWNTQNTLDTVISFPPGYQRMLEYNGAVEVSTRYPGTLRDDIAAIAVESKAKVKSLNHRTPMMMSDAVAVNDWGDKGGMYAGWADFLSGRT